MSDDTTTYSEGSRKYWDALTPEQRSEAMRRRWETRKANAEKRRREAEERGES